MRLDRTTARLALVSWGLAIASTAPAGAMSEACSAGWSSEFGVLTTDAPVQAMVVYDADGDGPGRPMLIVGGQFSRISGIEVSGIAAWDGTDWHTLGAGLAMSDDRSPIVSALAVVDEDGDGPRPPVLFAAGRFHRAGDVEALNIARWDGGTWSPVGAGIGGGHYDIVRELVLFDEDHDGPEGSSVFAGGYFSRTTGAAGDGLVRWSGIEWEPVGPGYVGDVSTLVVHDEDGPGPRRPALYAGGTIPSLGTGQAGHVVRWDGTSWSTLGTGLNGRVNQLVAIDGDESTAPLLHASGAFNATYGSGLMLPAQCAVWDGSAWSAAPFDLRLGNGVGSLAVRAAYDPDGDGPQPEEIIYAGRFDAVDGTPGAAAVRKRDGAWSPVNEGDGQPISGVRTMAVFDADGEGPLRPRLYVGGTFGYPYSGALPFVGEHFEGLAAWDGIAWSCGPDANGPWRRSGVEAGPLLRTHDPDGPGGEPTYLIARGGFTQVGAQALPGLAAWDGRTWRGILDPGSPEASASASAHDVASIDFDGLGGDDALLAIVGTGGPNGLHRVAVATIGAQQWTTIGEFTGPLCCSRLITWDRDGPGGDPPVLVVYGPFDEIDGVPGSGRVAQWDGSSWSPLLTDYDSHHEVFDVWVWDRDGTGPFPSDLIAIRNNRLVVLEDGAWRLLSDTPESNGGQIVAILPGDAPGSPDRILVSVGALRSHNNDCRLYMGGPDDWTRIGVVTDALGSEYVGIYRAALIDPDGPHGPLEDHLLIVGKFDHVEGMPSQNVALWDGQSWHAEPEGLDKIALYVVAVDHDGDGPAPPGVYLSGYFQRAGGYQAHRLTRWGPQSPRLVDQPIDLTTAVGASARFAVAVSAATPAIGFRWLRDGEELEDDDRISGSDSATLQISHVVESDAGVYSAVAIGCFGDSTSDPATLTVRITPPPMCAGDANGDGVVDAGDLSTMLSGFGMTVPPGSAADFNGDGIVNGADLSVLLFRFGQAC